ncbi:hypothetical protein LINPERPRIM_LOCUS30890 [Linum perenne]
MLGRPKKNCVRGVEERQYGVRHKRRLYTNDYLIKHDKNDSTKMSKLGRVMTCTSCHKEGHNKRACAKQGNGGTSGSRQPFEGIGVYTNVNTSRTILNLGSTSEVVLNHGSRQGPIDPNI